MTKITRRNRFKACLSYTPGATLKQCETMTAKTFMREYHELRRSNANASIFIDMFVNGVRVSDPGHIIIEELGMLAYGHLDEISLSVPNV